MTSECYGSGAASWGPDVDEVLTGLLARGRTLLMSGGRSGGRGWGPPAGAPPWAAWVGGGGRGWPFAPERGPGRPRAGKGDVRAAILLLLAEGPRHGYQLIGDIAERSGGAWRPSPGSVYPALAALADEGLVDDEKIEGRRVFTLTDAGTAYLDEHGTAFGDVFDANSADPEHEDVSDLRQLLLGVGAAALQVVSLGSPEQVAAARRILSGTRSDLFRLLADEPQEPR